MAYTITAIGQDSHRFEDERTGKKLLLAGVEIESDLALAGNSDADLLFHVICNAISGLTTRPVLGPRADALCKKGITDSRVYLNLALDDLAELRPDLSLVHLSISIEAKYPKLIRYFDAIRESISNCLSIDKNSIAITATTGEELTGMGEGRGMAATCILTAVVN